MHISEIQPGLDSWSRKPTRNLSKAPEEASAEGYCDPPRLPGGGGEASIVICIISQVLVGWCFGQVLDCTTVVHVLYMKLTHTNE